MRPFFLQRHAGLQALVLCLGMFTLGLSGHVLAQDLATATPTVSAEVTTSDKSAQTAAGQENTALSTTSKVVANSTVATTAEPAQTERELTPQVNTDTQVGIAGADGLMRLFIMLLACLMVILLSVFLIKRLRFSRVKSAHLQVDGILSLGAKEKVVLLKIKDRKLLLGVTPQQINLICDLTEAPQDENSTTTARSAVTAPAVDLPADDGSAMSAAEFAALMQETPTTQTSTEAPITQSTDMQLASPKATLSLRRRLKLKREH